MIAKRTVKLEQDTEKPIDRKVLDSEIIALSKAAKSLLSSGLARRDLVALIQERAKGVSKGTISDVLDAIDQLVRQYGG